MKLTIYLIDIGMGNSYVTPNSSNSNNVFARVQQRQLEQQQREQWLFGQAEP